MTIQRKTRAKRPPFSQRNFRARTFAKTLRDASRSQTIRSDLLEPNAATLSVSFGVMMTTETEERASDNDPDALQSLADEGDRPSITEVNGTVARFEMAYQPEPSERHAFGPPLVQKIPAMIWFLFTLSVTGVVVLAHHMSSNSQLYVWVVERDRNGIPASVLAFLVLASGIGVLVRSSMRGVIVHRAGIEARYVLPLGVPRVRTWSWAQVHRMVIDDDAVMLELWNGSYERLPRVARPSDLATILQHRAAEHSIVVTRLKELA